MNLLNRAASVAIAAVLCLNVGAQTQVKIGGGSIASYPPTYKAKTIDSNSGFNATAMLSRKIYVDEEETSGGGILQVPGRPLPTNDWWTDLINSKFSGALWSYPAMLSTSAQGVKINWPSYWADQGKEMKSRSNIIVGGYKFTPACAIASDWHDWDVVFRMPSEDESSEIKVTSVHGMPFTWFEFTKVTPQIQFSEKASLFGATDQYVGVKVGNDLYGLYFPKDATYSIKDGNLVFDQRIKWLSLGLLRTEADLENFASYSVSLPIETVVTWDYNEATSTINTSWKVTARNLRNKNATAPVLQGFLPHAYKYAKTGANLSFIDSEGYKTPRGKMKLAMSPSGDFSYSYQFSGMLPIFGAPVQGEGYNPSIMNELMDKYAKNGSFGGDTYWGGKGLTQMAMNMWFAKLTGNPDAYETSKAKLRDTFENWLNYTPGEDTFFFSYYPRWGAMLGFDVSYDSDAFNDHHFHYGYFTYAAALLCLEDKDFAEKYGEILTMIAKDYANWDKDDKRFPFMRTMDPWNGHSWAGGLGDAGNDNGNGQESTSEAMQGWGGLYLLGVALDNKEMRDAGIWGWSTEARATREYWYDVDAPRSANAGGRKAWSGKNDRQGNYDYSQYPYAYNSNITGKGIGWWTWFGGDPLFMHGIQWMPISPSLDYLSWDMDFTAWALDDMMTGANSSFSHDWFNYTVNSDNGERIEPLAYNDWGNVALSYMQRSDPKGAAEIFDKAYQQKLHIATAVSTGHISYYTIHSHLTYGDTDFSIHADIPTAQVCVKNGVNTYLVYNPYGEDRIVNFFNEKGGKIKSVNAPACKLAAICADPNPTAIECIIEGGTIIPPGETLTISARVLDQYGAGINGKKVSYSLSDGAPASISGNNLKINANAVKGSVFTLNLKSENLQETVKITVNDRPQGKKNLIIGLPEMCEKGTVITPEFKVEDQYGNVLYPEDTRWFISDSKGKEIGNSVPLTIERAGKYTVKVSSESLKATAEKQIFITPSLPIVSAGVKVAASSAENAGTLPEGLNDGDSNTRWGSAHTDNEWVVLDLGEDHFISNVSIDWEAAFATKYQIAIAPDGCATFTQNVEYAGQKKTVTIPQESAWITLVEVNNSKSGEKTTSLNSNGRYVRMKGVERATQYGYSIYEMNVAGVKLSTSKDEILGVDFELPPSLDRNQTVTLVPQVYTFGGEILTNSQVNWKSDKEADIKGNDFTPLWPGRYMITAVLSDKMETSSEVFVNDVELPNYVVFEKENYEAIQNEPIKVPFTVMNQFMAPYTGSLSSLAISIRDTEGQVVKNASYDPSSKIFRASDCGTYKIVFGDLGEVSMTVRPLSEVNLALGRPAAASTNNGGNTSSLVTDGNMGSRWESEWADNQNITVELDACYNVNKVKIFWEGAYAKKYTIEVSTDYENWTTVYEENNSKGGEENIEFSHVETKYLRINCQIRALENYGFSIWEIEVYGTEKLFGEEQPGEELPEYEDPDYDNPDYDDPWVDLPDPEDPGNQDPGNQDPGNQEPDTGVESILENTYTDGWYTLQGLRIPQPSRGGIYIRIKEGKAQKVLISQ